MIKDHLKKPSPGKVGASRVVRLLAGIQGGPRSAEQRLQRLAVRVQQLPAAPEHPVGHGVVVGRGRSGEGEVMGSCSPGPLIDRR